MEAAAKGSSKVKGSLPEMLLGPARISSSYSRTVPSHILSDTIYLSIHLSIYLSIYLSIIIYDLFIYLFTLSFICNQAFWSKATIKSQSVGMR